MNQDGRVDFNNFNNTTGIFVEEIGVPEYQEKTTWPFVNHDKLYHIKVLKEIKYPIVSKTAVGYLDIQMKK